MGEVVLTRTSLTLHPPSPPTAGTQAIIKVLGHQHWWLAGGYDLEIENLYWWLAWWLPDDLWLFCPVYNNTKHN